jgi:predicted aldo/keto reductase-like oxidoreductase
MRLEKRKLGSTGFNATLLGIGDLADRSVPLAKCVAIIHRAMDFGLNLIDTVPGYEDGYSEAIVGAPQMDASLGRLGLDMVDLFVFHAVSALQQWEKLAAPGGGLEQVSDLRQSRRLVGGLAVQSRMALRAIIPRPPCCQRHAFSFVPRLP